MNKQRQRITAINREPVGAGLIATPVSEQNGTPAHLRGLTYPRRVTNASTQLLAADYDRKFLFIQNNDAVGIVYLAFGAPAVVGQGMKLAANGGGILLDNNVPTAQVFAIGSIASNANINIITA
jgi:hypothetical protein